MAQSTFNFYLQGDYLMWNQVEGKVYNLFDKKRINFPKNWMWKKLFEWWGQRYNSTKFTLYHPENEHDVTEGAREYTLQDASFMCEKTHMLCARW